MTTATLYHAVEMHDRSPDARKDKAWQSWKRLYDGGVIPCHLWNYPRNATDIGDARALPYFKDVVKAALDKIPECKASCPPNDSIVLWTNDDVVLHPLLPGAVRLHCALFGACTAIRCEFDREPMPKLNVDPSVWAAKSSPHCGRDAFAATVQWWREHWDEVPDAILAAPCFDLHLAALVRRHKSFVTTHKNLSEVLPGCELPMGLIGHESHQPHWTTVSADTPSHVHNRTLFLEWCKANNLQSPL